MRPGIDAFLSDPARYLGAARRVALLANQASLTGDGRSTLEALRACADVDLVALLTLEHGWSGFEDDATPVPDGRHPAAGLALHSLYGPRRRPETDVLASFDAVVVDVQEVGVRCYTYATSLALLLEEAAVTGTRVVVCDRPTLLGPRSDGPPLDPARRSFLGYLDLPFQHGLTLGELAAWYVAERLGGAAALVVAPLEGWRRDDPVSGPWLPPSPGLPTLASVQTYPGLVLLEGCNLSEGRGTTLPFQLLGAPWCEGYALARALNALELAGLRFRPLDFRPVSGSHSGEVCHGVQLLVTDAGALRPLQALTWVLAHVRAAHEEFTWLDAGSMPWAGSPDAGQPWFEPVDGHLVDALTGSDEVRAVVDGKLRWDDVEARWAEAARDHLRAVEPYLRYRPSPAQPNDRRRYAT